MHTFATQPARWLMALGALLLMATSAQADTLSEFSAEYQVEKFNSIIGRTSYRLKRETDHVHFFMRTELAGFIALLRNDRVEEDSWLQENNGKLRLLRYSYKQEGSKHNRNTRLGIEWQQDHTTGLATGSHAGKAVSIPVSDGVSDALSFQLSLMQDAADEDRALEYSVLNKDKLRQYVFRRLEHEDLEIRDQVVKTLVVERVHDNRSTRLWLAIEYQYTPVRIEIIEDGDTDSRMLVDELIIDGKRVL